MLKTDIDKEEAARAKRREYREKNKEMIKESSRLYRAKNKDKEREYYQKNKEKQRYMY